MKQTRRWCRTPSSGSGRVKPRNWHSHSQRRGSGSQGPPGKKHHQAELLYAKGPVSPTIVIHHQEMESYLRLFEDDLIQDFLFMDCCHKMTDKYLLAMTFVYFKRARFALAEYTRRNFFLALYLANTMEEDEDENKYEIFPWALGKSWRKQFPRFLKQRDRLWIRMDYRAAVSRHCCEEVMAIVPSHFAWQRQRSEHHSGAQRQYGDRDHISAPRGPAASPLFCALCQHSTTSDPGPVPSPPDGGSAARTLNLTGPDPLAPWRTLETTPPRAAASRRTEPRGQVQQSCSCCAEGDTGDDSSYGFAYDRSMDWMSEE